MAAVSEEVNVTQGRKATFTSSKVCLVFQRAEFIVLSLGIKPRQAAQESHHRTSLVVAVLLVAVSLCAKLMAAETLDLVHVFARQPLQASDLPNHRRIDVRVEVVITFSR